MELVVSAERLRAAEELVADLKIELEKAGPADKPAVERRLEQAIEHLEILRKSRILGM